MSAQKFNHSGPMSTVRSAPVISYSLGTKITIDFDQNISAEGFKFLQHANKNPLTRMLSPYRHEFGRLLAEDGYNVDELMEILTLVQYTSSSSITFGSEQYLDRWKVNQALRGLDVLHNLSVLGKDMQVVSGQGIFRINENEIRKVEYVDNAWQVTNGWISPVWSEKSYRIS